MDSLGHEITEEKELLEIELIAKEPAIAADSVLRDTNTVMADKSIAVDDSLMRSLDEDPNDTISVIMTTPDTLEVNMYPKGEKGYSPRVDMSKSGGKTTLTIYDETGSHTAEILDGSGSGLDVRVNGTSVVEDNVADIRLKTINNQSIVGTGNIEIQGGEGTKNYDTLQNKPKINNTTLQGNLSSDDLGLQSKITANNKLDFSLVDNAPNIPSKTSDLTNDSGFVTKSVNNLDNYYNKNYINDISANVETNTQAIAALDEEKANIDDLATVATTGKYGDLLNKPNIPNVVDNVTSIDTANALSAYQGKLLNDRINNVESRGRFLAIWNAATGKPLTDPAELPYTYRTGDWYRVGTTAAVNYMPNGSQYDGTASRVPYTDPIATGDCFWYDGTTWKLEVNHAVEGGVQDVLINGTSIVSDNSANILVDGTYSSSNKIATQSSIPTRVGQLTNDAGYITNSYHDATKQDKLANQTAYSNKGTATKVPQITTNSLGQVTNITEVNITQPTVNDATLTIQRNGSNVGTFSANASANKTVNITVPTTATDVNAIPKAFSTSAIASKDGAKTAIVQYGGNLVNGALTGINILNLGVNKAYRCYERGATITCNYSDVASNVGTNMFDGSYSGWFTTINPSVDFINKPFILEMTRPTSYEYTDVLRLCILGHRLYGTCKSKKYKLEVAYAYSNGTYSWATAIDYDSNTEVELCQSYFGLFCTEAGIENWHQVFGIRLTIYQSSATILQIGEIMLFSGRGTEQPYEALHTVPDQGGRFYGGIEATQFKKTGGTSSQFLKADGSVDSNTYGKITEIRMNGASKGTSGIVDLGNIATSEELANKEDKSNKTNSYTASSTTTYPNTKALVDGLATKQNTLVSGTNIKTVNGQSLLGSGDIAGGLIDDVKVNGTSVVSNKVANIDLTDYAKEEDIPTKTSDLTNDSDFITSSYHDNTKQDTLVSGTNIKTVNNQSLLGSGNITVESGGKADGITTRLNSNNQTEVIGIYTTQENGRKIWEGTWNQYNALPEKDNSVYYYITDDADDTVYQVQLVSGVNIKTVNNQTILGSGNLEIEGAFIAEYDVTSYNTIADIFTNSDKPIYVKKGDLILPLVSKKTGEKFIFSGIVDESRYTYIQVALSGGWSTLVDAGLVLTNAASITEALGYTPQAQLTSGTNIKTVNGESILGSGNISAGEIIKLPWAVVELTSDSTENDIFNAFGGRQALTDIFNTIYSNRDVKIKIVDLDDDVDEPWVEDSEVTYVYAENHTDNTYKELQLKITVGYTSYYTFDLEYADTKWKVVECKKCENQEKLKSGINIKTINNQTIVGSGNIAIRAEADVQSWVDQGFDYSIWGEPDFEMTNYGSYPFTWQSSGGYYESTNQGHDATYSLCKITFDLDSPSKIKFDYVNYAESGYDYGIFSNIDCTLSQSNNEDSGSNVRYSCKGNSSPDWQTLIYEMPAGEHFIYVKYRKDGSVSNYNDSLRFKVSGVVGITTKCLSIGEEFSTVERKIGTWVDGKPLYRRTYYTTMGSTLDTSYNLIETGLTNISEIWVDQTYSFYKVGTQRVPSTFYLSATDYARLWMDGTIVRAKTNSSGIVGQPAYVTILYTKTTD